MKIGVAYYPERWSEERWALDAEMMAQLRIDLVRLGEYAWSRLEPRRERFDMDWLDRAVEVLSEHGLQVLLCTPTAAPPAWLFERHPSILPLQADGRQWYGGSRHHACLSNPAYQKYARRITSELARRFSGNPHLYGWQLHDSPGAGGSGMCYCEECEQEFRRWLKRRYGTIERLNTQWGTDVWSQGFSDWHEIPAPRETPSGPHPSLALDYRRFVSSRHQDFLEEQRELIQQYAGERGIPIVTNCAGVLELPHINLFRLATVQDVAAVQNFPKDLSRLDHTALQLDAARSLKRKAFWALGQQAGAVDVPRHAGQPKPGQLRLWSYQAAARGAELILYFRWRTSTAGQQMHWSGMLDADGTPRRRFEELRNTIGELKQHSQLWEGRLPQTDVALFADYDSAWSLEAAPLGAGLDYFAQVRTFYAVLRHLGAHVDLVTPASDLLGYKVAIVPMPLICTDQAARKLQVFTHQGGRVIVTAPAGYRTPANTAIDAAPPGALSGLLGVEVREHDVLRPGERNAVELHGFGRSFPTGNFCSVLRLRGAEVLGTYDGQYYADSPAVTIRSEGEGEAMFVGATCSTECYEVLFRRALEDAGADLSEWASPTLEVIPWRGTPEQTRLVFVLNHSADPVSLDLPGDQPASELLTGRDCENRLMLAGYGVALLKL